MKEQDTELQGQALEAERLKAFKRWLYLASLSGRPIEHSLGIDMSRSSKGTWPILQQENGLALPNQESELPPPDYTFVTPFGTQLLLFKERHLAISSLRPTEPAHLTPIQYALFEVLIEHPLAVISTQILGEKLAEQTAAEGRTREQGYLEYVKTHITHIRRSLGATSQEALIYNIPTVGYSLTPDESIATILARSSRVGIVLNP